MECQEPCTQPHGSPPATKCDTKRENAPLLTQEEQGTQPARTLLLSAKRQRVPSPPRASLAQPHLSVQPDPLKQTPSREARGLGLRGPHPSQLLKLPLCLWLALRGPWLTNRTPHCPPSLPETLDRQELRRAQEAHHSVTGPKDTRGHWLDHCLSREEGASPGGEGPAEVSRRPDGKARPNPASSLTLPRLGGLGASKPHRLNPSQLSHPGPCQLGHCPATSARELPPLSHLPGCPQSPPAPGSAGEHC